MNERCITFHTDDTVRDIEGDRYLVVAVNDDGTLDIRNTEGSNPKVQKSVPAKFFVRID